ncbi:MAG: alpha/beta hydrolase [Bacteroidales bacterium]|nr:alpha/beta hydrolase [Bacteroidales bacterium]
MPTQLIENTIPKSSIHYWTNQSDAETCIVFLHSAFMDHTCFDAQIDYFAPRCKVIALDLIGHGASIGKGDIAETSNMVSSILEKENVLKANMVGVSMGAVLAADFANKFPDKVASLCCVGGYDINNFDHHLRLKNNGEHLKIMMAAFFSKKRFAEMCKAFVVTPEAQKKVGQLALRFKKRQFRHLANLEKLVNQQKKPKRDYPLMIAVGEFENGGLEASQQWRKHEPKSIYIVFKGAGHIANMDVPEAFNQELEKILR